MKINTELSERIFEALEAAGFSHQEFDDDIYQPVNELHNDMNVYIGDVLETIGFKKGEEMERNKTWTTFRHEDGVIISHRSFKDRPQAHGWSMKW